MQSQDATKKGLHTGGSAGLRARIRAIRWISQATFLVVFLFLVTGTVCTAILGKGVAISEPAGVLQLLFANVANLTPTFMTQTLIVGTLIFVGLVVLLGRAFCAWACPVGTTIDAIDSVLQKLKFRPYFTRRSTHKDDAPETSLIRSGMNRYAVLASVLTGSALFSYPVWCAVCPIGTLCRGVVAGAELALGAELLAVPAVGALSLGEKRFWCRYLCPVGGVLTLLSKLNPFVKPKIRQEAEHRDCGACRAICPEGIDICNEKSFARCTKCLDCYAKCPFGSVKIAWTR